MAQRGGVWKRSWPGNGKREQVKAEVILCPLLPPVCIDWNITSTSYGTQTVFMPRNSNCCLFYRKESLDYSTLESSKSTTLGKKWRMLGPLGVEQGIFFFFLMKDLEIPKCATWAFAELTKKTKTKLSSDPRKCSRLTKIIVWKCCTDPILFSEIHYAFSPCCLAHDQILSFLNRNWWSSCPGPRAFSLNQFRALVSAEGAALLPLTSVVKSSDLRGWTQ